MTCSKPPILRRAQILFHAGILMGVFAALLMSSHKWSSLLLVPLLVALICAICTGCMIGGTRAQRAAAYEVFRLPASGTHAPGSPSLRIEVRRLPEGFTLANVQASCAKGVAAPGDIELIDLQDQIDSKNSPAIRVTLLDGSGLVWEGEAKRSWYEGIPLDIAGYLAACARPGGRDFWRAESACAVARAGWTEEAVMTARAWWIALHSSVEAQRFIGMYHFIRSTHACIPEPERSKLWQEWLSAAIAGMSNSSDRHARRFGGLDAGRLLEHPVDGLDARSVVRQMDDAGLRGSDPYLSVVRATRVTLVEQHEYAIAIDGDPNPVGAWRDEEFMRGIAELPIKLAPASMIPFPYADQTTPAQRQEVKEGAFALMDTMYRAKGMATCEALVARNRMQEAERMKRELLSRLQTETLATELDEASARAIAWRKSVVGTPKK